MLLTSVQPPIVSLFSSTGSDPLQLFSVVKDESRPTQSVIALLNDSDSEAEEGDFELVPLPSVGSNVDEGLGYSLSQTVLHIQSPVLQSTFIQSKGELGIKHPWLHLQVRNLGRDWCFEVGVVDRMKRRGTIRFSTFQKSPRLYPSLDKTTPDLLHLILSFPAASSSTLTAWSTISINIPPLLKYFSDRSLVQEASEQEQTTGLGPAPIVGSFSHISYIKVYAACRLRRIWFSETGSDKDLPWEFKLYSS